MHNVNIAEPMKYILFVFHHDTAFHHCPGLTRPKPAKLSRRYARSHCVMFVNHVVCSSLTRKSFTVICDKHCVVVFVVNVLVF